MSHAPCRPEGTEVEPLPAELVALMDRVRALPRLEREASIPGDDAANGDRAHSYLASSVPAGPFST